MGSNSTQHNHLFLLSYFKNFKTQRLKISLRVIKRQTPELIQLIALLPNARNLLF